MREYVHTYLYVDNKGGTVSEKIMGMEDGFLKWVDGLCVKGSDGYDATFAFNWEL